MVIGYKCQITFSAWYLIEDCFIYRLYNTVLDLELGPIYLNALCKF